jgi:hypothetical protein
MSIVNVNIKNCNCSGGSGSGSDSGSSSGTDVFDGDLGQSADQPPQGYSQSEVSDRECKTAVWIYDWVHNWLDFMSGSAWFVALIIATFANATVGRYIVRPLASAIGTAIGAVAALIGTPGLDPTDPVTILIARATAEFMVENAINYGANELTQTMVESSVSTFEDNRDAFICAIARGGNPNAAASNLETLLAAEFPSPIQWLIFNLSQVFLNLAYFSANWWPGFEDEISGITETCCGGLVNGNPITPGSTQACTGANFVLDNLVSTLTTADSYVQNYSRTVYNGVTASEAIMLSNVQSSFVVPANISSKAWSWPLCQAELARYMWAKLGGDSWLTPGPGVNTWEMGRLGADLQVNIAVCELRDAETPQAAYELLAAQIDAWLTAEVTDQDLSSHIRLFCQGLIHPAGAFVGVLFAESADLAGFAGTSDCSECVVYVEQQVIFGISAWTNIGTYQAINSINDTQVGWGNLTFHNGAVLTFFPGQYSAYHVKSAIVWSEARNGGVSAIYADGNLVSNGGAFTSGELNGSYQKEYIFSAPVLSPTAIAIHVNAIIAEAPVFEIQFVILVPE